MNPSDRCETGRDPLEVERLVSADRRITVADHQAFRASIASPPPFDPIDEAVEELLSDPRLDHLPAYRSEREAGGLLAILDALERGEG